MTDADQHEVGAHMAQLQRDFKNPNWTWSDRGDFIQQLQRLVDHLKHLHLTEATTK